ncbi:IS66 family insertion sequence element accessory protein TnpB [Vibrio penaeicida]|nr:IS66 family insertion sequence element accessory protein TnpB [Vibrio penaeicida]
MRMFAHVSKIYLHKTLVDFHKGLNGLSLLVEQQMALSPFSGTLFVFFTRHRDKLKVLYWDKTGFSLWHKHGCRYCEHESTEVAEK